MKIPVNAQNAMPIGAQQIPTSIEEAENLLEIAVLQIEQLRREVERLEPQAEAYRLIRQLMGTFPQFGGFAAAMSDVPHQINEFLKLRQEEKLKEAMDK